jgi:CDGSH-type Zn-finger protein/uncharacterized Fe-S cluster protein YjdI
MSKIPKRYVSDAIDVTFDTKRCIHAAECVRRLPAVFATRQRPWIQPEKASAGEIAAVVQRCPTGALHYERKDGEADEQVPAQNIIQVRADGPLYVRGNVRIVTPEGAIVVEDVRMALCRCGHTQHKPYCDNTHLLLGFHDDGRVEANDVIPASQGGELVVKLRANGPLKLEGEFALVSSDLSTIYVGTETALCRCGGSHTKPFCDGTHRTNGFQA